MTYVESETLTCPGCGKKAIARIHTTQKVTVDPELREALFNSQINQFQCPSCGSQAAIVAPLMYHDMEREFAIQLSLEHFMDDEEFYATFDNDPLTRNDDLALISTEQTPLRDAATLMGQRRRLGSACTGALAARCSSYDGFRGVMERSLRDAIEATKAVNTVQWDVDSIRSIALTIFIQRARG